jgi:hypothetical protein
MRAVMGSDEYGRWRVYVARERQREELAAMQRRR